MRRGSPPRRCANARISAWPSAVWPRRRRGKKGAAAELAPQLRLSGSVGFESLNSGNLFSAGSQGFSIGPLILSWPFFNAGALRRNVRAQGAREKALLAAYEKTVLKAAAEVRDALAACGQENLRRQSLKAGRSAARRALELAEDRYRHGLSDCSDVLAAQGALLSLEDGLAENAGSMTGALIRLYKALGGGWAPLSPEGRLQPISGAVKRGR